jgi:excinuclease ABC subunit B
MGKKFNLKSKFQPKGDQIRAIKELVLGVESGASSQVLLGVTGSGKTFTMANVINQTNRAALILAHNKTLAAQLYQEFKEFFPENAVEYFVSYYDYYQPEAYLARSDTYIEKDLAINEEINRMRLSATRSLVEREDVIIVSSVSCIYGLGSKKNYEAMVFTLKMGQKILRDKLLFQLIMMHFTRADMDFTRGSFRVRGDIIELFPTYEDKSCYRIEFFGDEIERISITDPLTGKVIKRVEEIIIFPGSHHTTPEDIKEEALIAIDKELDQRIAYFKEREKYAEQMRIRARTRYDMEMIKEVGFCKGIENYSRHFDGRKEGEPPCCLMDYFPNNYLLFVDESHQTIPQVRAMIHGDRSRKNALIEYGFRLPSAYDNRPLSFEEFYEKKRQTIYVSATPSEWEISETNGIIVSQVIRPTALLDPLIEVRSATNQLDNCIEEIKKETELGRRTLVTCLTKKLSEEITSYLKEIGVKAIFLHSDIKTLERMHIINDLKTGKYDVLVGINLLREGLDIPEVSLVAILDADREGFLRSETALIQTCGRAARNVNGRVILYGDKITKSMENCIKTTNERRALQEKYNKDNNAVPKTTTSSVSSGLFNSVEKVIKEESVNPKDIEKKINELKKQMKKAADNYEFELAATLRDSIKNYTNLLLLE